MLCDGTHACADPWPFPRRVPGPRQTTYPCAGRLCPPKALAPIAAGYNTSRSTGFPTLNTVPSWLASKGLGECSPRLPCPNPWWHDYSLGAPPQSDFDQRVSDLIQQEDERVNRVNQGDAGGLWALGALLGVGGLLLLIPFGIGGVAGAVMSPEGKKKKGFFLGALGGGAGGMATGSIIPGTGLLGAAVGGGLVGKYVVAKK
jgi:hypothetical protein